MQIKTEDDRVLNILYKHKNAAYKVTPLGMLFPASMKSDTGQIFITCREINDVKKPLLNSKIIGLLGIINLRKINKSNEIKGQSLWINATLEEQRKINNSRHICFPFMTLALSDLLNFSKNLVDDNNKQIELVSNEKNQHFKF